MGKSRRVKKRIKKSLPFFAILFGERFIKDHMQWNGYWKKDGPKVPLWRKRK